MTNITAELLEKAKTAKTVEELMTLAKENKVEITEEQANAFLTGKLTDSDLDMVVAGRGFIGPTKPKK